MKKQTEVNFELKWKYIIRTKEEQMFRYIFQMYNGPMKYKVKVEGIGELITIRAFGIKVITEIDGECVKEYDFGYLSAESYELAHLVNVAARTRFDNFDHLRKSIRMESASWGEEVFDIYGKRVLDGEFNDVKRDPFARAARRALKKIMQTKRKFEQLGKAESGGGAEASC